MCWRRGGCCCLGAEAWWDHGHCEVSRYSSEGSMLCAVEMVSRIGHELRCTCKAYLGHSDSAGQTASNGTLLGVASSRSTLAAVLSEDVLRKLLILALLAALK
jgi:hypothetical protein